NGSLADNLKGIAEETSRARSDLYDKLRMEKAGIANDADQATIEAAEREGETLSWATLIREAEELFVNAGVNPAGAGPSVAQSVGDEPWYRAYGPPHPGAWQPLPGDVARPIRLERTQQTAVSVAEAVFDRASRD